MMLHNRRHQTGGISEKKKKVWLLEFPSTWWECVVLRELATNMVPHVVCYCAELKKHAQFPCCS